MSLLAEILDHFDAAESSPGDNWAFCDDRSSLGLDYRSPDGTKFWLDINKDGTISIFWRPSGADGQSLTFAPQRR